MTAELNHPTDQVADPRSIISARARQIMRDAAQLAVPTPAERCAHVRQLIAQRGLTGQIESHARMLIALAVTAEGYKVHGRAAWGKPSSAAVLSCTMI